MKLGFEEKKIDYLLLYNEIPRMRLAALFASLLFLLVGCKTTPIPSGESNALRHPPAIRASNTKPTAIPSGEKPVRYAQYVKIATFDTTPRPPTSKLIVLREVPNRKYHIIASLTISGTADKEGNLVNAIAWKARQIGADSIILLPPLHPHRDEWVFRADAILMDSEQ